MDNTRGGTLIPNELTDLIFDIERIKNKLNNQDKNIEIAFRHLSELLEKQEEANLPRIKISFKPDTLSFSQT